MVIATNALGAHSVFAIDLDEDGDTDVLSASCFDDKIAGTKTMADRLRRTEILLKLHPTVNPATVVACHTAGQCQD